MIAIVFPLLSLVIGAAHAFQSARVLTTGFRNLTRRWAVVDIDDRAGRDIGAFQDWCQANGVQRSGGFQLGSDDGFDWIAGTTEDLATGSPILSVPDHMIFSSQRVRQELQIKDAVDQLNRLGASADVEEFFLFVKIIVEYEKGEESPWFPWLNSLPRLFYNAISMTDFCYECLPPLVFSLARKERVKFLNFGVAIDKIDFITAATKNNQDIMKWVYNIVTTRCFGPDDNKRIVPMGDMFNHGTEKNAEMNFDEDGNCVVYATRDVPANSQLLMSYGDPTNPSLLFAKYGFLDETSPATFCKIMNIQPTPQLVNLGLDFSRMLFYKDTGDISEEVWDVMLYTQVLKNEQDVQNTFYEAHMNGDTETKTAIHQHYFPQTSAALLQHVDTFLEQLDSLSEKAEGRDISEHPRLPLILRHNDFVKETFLKVKGKLYAMLEESVAQPV